MNAVPLQPHKHFAIVCDSACDLPLATLGGAEIVLAPMHVTFGGKDLRDCLDVNPVDFFVQLSSTGGTVGAHSPSPEEFERIYRALRDQGYSQIVSVHASSHMRDAASYAAEAASAFPDLEVEVLDTHCFSGQMALVIARLALDRRAGLDMHEALIRARRLASQAQLLLVPAVGLGPARRDIARAFSTLAERVSSLRSRALGIRRVLSLNSDGEFIEEGSSSDIDRLCATCVAHMASYEREEGPLTYVEINAGVPRQLEDLHTRIAKTISNATRAAILNTNPTTTSQLGMGAMGVAYVPAALLSPEEARRFMEKRRP